MHTAASALCQVLSTLGAAPGILAQSGGKPPETRPWFGAAQLGRWMPENRNILSRGKARPCSLSVDKQMIEPLRRAAATERTRATAKARGAPLMRRPPAPRDGKGAVEHGLRAPPARPETSTGLANTAQSRVSSPGRNGPCPTSGTRGAAPHDRALLVIPTALPSAPPPACRRPGHQARRRSARPAPGA